MLNYCRHIGGIAKHRQPFANHGAKVRRTGEVRFFVGDPPVPADELHLWAFWSVPMYETPSKFRGHLIAEDTDRYAIRLSIKAGND